MASRGRDSVAQVLFAVYWLQCGYTLLGFASFNILAQNWAPPQYPTQYWVAVFTCCVRPSLAPLPHGQTHKRG